MGNAIRTQQARRRARRAVSDAATVAARLDGGRLDVISTASPARVLRRSDAKRANRVTIAAALLAGWIPLYVGEFRHPTHPGLVLRITNDGAWSAGTGRRVRARGLATTIASHLNHTRKVA